MTKADKKSAVKASKSTWAYFGSSWWVVLSLSWLIMAWSWLILGRFWHFLGLPWAALTHLGPVFGTDGSQDEMSWGGVQLFYTLLGAKMGPKIVFFWCLFGVSFY